MATRHKNPFRSRPTRREPCHHCGGSGSVVESYALVEATTPVKGAPNGALSADVVGCSGIFECCREALQLANATRKPIAFDFNALVVVRPGDDPDKIARAWWKKTYGETPKQTAARR